MLQKIKNWYQGKLIFPENEPDSGVIFVSPGYYEKPFMARVLSRFFVFWLKNWQFIVGTLVAVFLAIFYNK